MDIEVAAPPWRASREAEGDFSGFCELHYERVASAVLLYVAVEDLARECTQEAFARAYRDWRKVRTMETPVAWVYRVAVNVANSTFRRRRIERRYRELVPPAGAPADDGVVAATTIRAALARIPPRRRAALIMRHYWGFPISEIADALGCSEDGAKKLIQRAKASLRAELDR